VGASIAKTVAALRDQVTQLTGASTATAGVEMDDLPTVPAATEEALYRIITEVVTNVVRHPARERSRKPKSSTTGAGYAETRSWELDHVRRMNASPNSRTVANHFRASFRSCMPLPAGRWR
jgi:hypothetical protein